MGLISVWLVVRSCGPTASEQRVLWQWPSNKALLREEGSGMGGIHGPRRRLIGVLNGSLMEPRAVGASLCLSALAARPRKCAWENDGAPRCYCRFGHHGRPSWIIYFLKVCLQISHVLGPPCHDLARHPCRTHQLIPRLPRLILDPPQGEPPSRTSHRPLPQNYHLSPHPSSWTAGSRLPTPVYHQHFKSSGLISALGAIRQHVQNQQLRLEAHTHFMYPRPPRPYCRRDHCVCIQ